MPSPGRLCQIRVDEPGLVQDGPIEARALQIRPVELGTAKIAGGEVEAREIEVRQPLSLQICGALVRVILMHRLEKRLDLGRVLPRVDLSGLLRSTVRNMPRHNATVGALIR